MSRRWRKGSASNSIVEVAAVAATLPVTYCEGWNDVLNQPFQPMSEAEARRRHETGELYSALFGDPAAPQAMVEVRLETGYVATHFFDDRLRRFASYIYEERDGKLFFESFSERWWDRKGALRATVGYRFEPDGHTYVRNVDRVRNVEETYEQWVTVDDNWEDIPTFGDYSGVLRIERDIHPLDGPPGSPSD